MAPPSLLASLLLKITEEFPLNVTAILCPLMYVAPTSLLASLLLKRTDEFPFNVTAILYFVMYAAPPHSAIFLLNFTVQFLQM